MKYLFEPHPGVSQQREVADLVSRSGNIVVLRWNGTDYTRDLRTDFVREVMA